MAATTEVQRMIQSVFVTQLRAHPLTFAMARSMHCEETLLTVVACWWMAFKFEEVDTTLTVDDLHNLFPAIVNGGAVRNAEHVGAAVPELLHAVQDSHARDLRPRLPADRGNSTAIGSPPSRTMVPCACSRHHTGFSS